MNDEGYEQAGAEEAMVNGQWFDDEEAEEIDSHIREYDITASPNDFNTLTLFNFIESGVVKIPAFQRNYVWDIKRASKLIESMIIGLPVPQIFLYEEARNSFLVIDGQQRLMSLYYFIKQRFPKKEKRIELRRIFDSRGIIPNDVLEDDSYFSKFNLLLPEQLPTFPNRLNKLNYSTLGDLKTTFDLRTIRNIIIKQTSPPDDDSSIYEIFNRLNSGGMNLKPQEIRTSLYHSKFYELLYRLNGDMRWRKLLGISEPDLHMKDVEVLLRGVAMLVEGEKYSPSMVKFLNNFSRKSKATTDEQNQYLERLFQSFLKNCESLGERPFHGRKTSKFNISLFEAVFAVQCGPAFKRRDANIEPFNNVRFDALKDDSDFAKASLEKTTSTTNVKFRLSRAKEFLNA
jgi:uncharacterized protein with ParB-like and HNH nuclease domain